MALVFIMAIVSLILAQRQQRANTETKDNTENMIIPAR